MDAKKLLLPALGLGALYYFSRGTGGGRISGTVPAGRPIVRLVFKAEKTPFSSMSNIADLATAQVAGVTDSATGSPYFTVVAAATAATPGDGTLGYAFTTVLARVAGYLEGQPWDVVLGPLYTPFGGIIKGNIELADVAQVASEALDLSRQDALAAGTPGVLDVTGIFKDLNSLTGLALTAGVLVGGYLLVKELGLFRSSKQVEA